VCDYPKCTICPIFFCVAFSEIVPQKNILIIFLWTAFFSNFILLFLNTNFYFIFCCNLFLFFYYSPSYFLQISFNNILVFLMLRTLIFCLFSDYIYINCVFCNSSKLNISVSGIFLLYSYQHFFSAVFCVILFFYLLFLCCTFNAIFSNYSGSICSINFAQCFYSRYCCTFVMM